MKISANDSTEAVLKELGRRIARYRLNSNMSQDTFAREAGVSKRTIQRLEYGYSIQSSNLVRILRVFDLLENLDAVIPEPAPSPVQQVRMQGKIRQRASSRGGSKDQNRPWNWEHEE
jgi:transcriptional regulator with XRE-family HTH domain